LPDAADEEQVSSTCSPPVASTCHPLRVGHTAGCEPESRTPPHRWSGSAATALNAASCRAVEAHLAHEPWRQCGSTDQLQAVPARVERGARSAHQMQLPTARLWEWDYWRAWTHG
jgi:hypothetical protein